MFIIHKKKSISFLMFLVVCRAKWWWGRGQSSPKPRRLSRQPPWVDAIQELSAVLIHCVDELSLWCWSCLDQATPFGSCPWCGSCTALPHSLPCPWCWISSQLWRLPTIMLDQGGEISVRTYARTHACIFFMYQLTKYDTTGKYIHKLSSDLSDC